MNLYKEDMLVLQRSVSPLQNIADDLRSALDDPSQFAMRYQPIIDSKTRKVELAQALIRWTSPILGQVAPGRFISVAEQNGLIREVTSMVLRKVCEDVAKEPSLLISVNISPLDIVDEAFSRDLQTNINEYDIDPKQITLEVTDHVSPQEASLAATNLRKVRQQGHAVAIHQLETGFTSFGFLKMAGYTLLKINKELLDEALDHPESREQLRDALNASKSKGFKSLAVGVETEFQAKLVEDLGFDLQQGFFHSDALTLDELMEFSGNRTQASS